MTTEIPVSIAPMMDWTDRHCRYFLRLLTPNARLYTEMVTAAAIVHGDSHRFLRYDAAEHPVALQLGGSDVAWMTSAAAIAAQYSYDEININVGCPSDRVQSGQFGACLMAVPDKVAACFVSMSDKVETPITIKTRIGIDDQDSYDFLRRFVDTLIEAGCKTFVVHARIQLKRDYPELRIVLNGGIKSIADVDTALGQVDGVMIGREAYQNPYFLAELEEHLRKDWAKPTRHDVVEQMLPYIEQELASGERLSRITRHMSGLFLGRPGARAWRRHLSENAYKAEADTDVIIDALKAMPMAA
jgi:tRNA-dihydrouridine synthase A